MLQDYNFCCSKVLQNGNSAAPKIAPNQKSSVASLGNNIDVVQESRGEFDYVGKFRRRDKEVFCRPVSEDVMKMSPSGITAWRHPADCLQERTVRKAPVCFQCGICAHMAHFCLKRRRLPPPQYEQLPASSRRTSKRGNYRGPPNGYYGSNFHQNFRGDSPASVWSMTPPTFHQRISPSSGCRRLTSPALPGN